MPEIRFNYISNLSQRRVKIYQKNPICVIQNFPSLIFYVCYYTKCLELFHAYCIPTSQLEECHSSSKCQCRCHTHIILMANFVRILIVIFFQCFQLLDNIIRFMIFQLKYLVNFLSKAYWPLTPRSLPGCSKWA